MTTLIFKTNINCSNCVARVTPFLNNNKEIEAWKVDTESPDKILTVEGHNITAADVVSILKPSGFTIESIQGS